MMALLWDGKEVSEEVVVKYDGAVLKTTKVKKILGIVPGFYTKLNVWGSLGLNFEYDGGPIIEIGGPIFLYKLLILEGSTSFCECSVLSPGQ